MAARGSGGCPVRAPALAHGPRRRTKREGGRPEHSLMHGQVLGRPHASPYDLPD